MSRPPRSKRVVNLLNALERIYATDAASPSERLQAATLAVKLLGARKKPAKRQVKSHNVKNALEQIRQLQNEEKK